MIMHNVISSRRGLLALCTLLISGLMLCGYDLLAQDSGSPFDLQQIIDLLEADIDETELISQIRRQGACFDLSFENGAILGKAGASEELMRVIIDNQHCCDPEITLESFVRNSHISGTVTCIQDYSLYKVIVYVYTDKWYIHPYTESAGEIDGRGKWEVGSVDRAPTPTRIAAFLVDRDVSAPSSIRRPGEIDAVATAFSDYY